MATLKLRQLCCIRKQDVHGGDEPEIYVKGDRVWDGFMKKGEEETIRTDDIDFVNTCKVELKERNGSLNKGSRKSLGTQTVSDSAKTNRMLEYKTSGAHYQLFYDVVA